ARQAAKERRWENGDSNCGGGCPSRDHCCPLVTVTCNKLSASRQAGRQAGSNLQLQTKQTPLFPLFFSTTSAKGSLIRYYNFIFKLSLNERQSPLASPPGDIELCALYAVNLLPV